MKQFAIATFLTASLLAGCSVHPDSLSDAEMANFVGLNADTLVADQEAISGPIGLYEAMARALKYNLDHRVEMMSATLAARAADVKSAAMLPQIVAQSNYSGRDNDWEVIRGPCQVERDRLARPLQPNGKPSTRISRRPGTFWTSDSLTFAPNRQVTKL